MNAPFLDLMTTAQTETTGVLPYARVVASGLTDDGKRLRATVLITPDPSGSASASHLTLEGWTQGIVGLIRQGCDGKPWTLPLKIVPAIYNAAPAGTLVPDPCSEKATKCGVAVIATARALRQTWDKVPEQDLAKLDGLWRSIFSDKDGQPLWSHLKTALETSLSGNSYEAGEIAKPGDPTVEKTTLGSRGEIKIPVDQTGKTKVIDSIVSIQQGDLSLGLEFKRVQEFCASLREANGEVGARASQELEAWRTELLRAQAANTVNPPKQPEFADPKLSKDKIAEAVDKAITKAKQEEHQDLSTKLNDARKEAKRAYEAAKGCIGATVCGPSDIPGAGISKKPAGLVGAGIPDIEVGVDKALASHGFGTWSQYARGDEDEKRKAVLIEEQEAAQRAAQNFFSLQTSPSLARLFCLAIDVEFDRSVMDDLIAKCAASAGGACTVEGANKRFIFIATPFGDDFAKACGASSACPQTWTIAKYAREAGGGRDHFWPASVAELNLEPGCTRDATNVAQYDGRLVLGAGWNHEDPKNHNPRFDVSSLDVRSAAEMERQKRQNREADAAEQLRRQSEDNIPVSGPPTDPRNTYMTAGLTLIDKGRQAHAARQLASRELKRPPKGTVVLDAEDLTVGYRLDVAIPNATGYRWTSLMNRYVDHGTSGADGPLVRRLLKTLVGAPDSGQRVALEAAMISLPGRYVPKGDTGTKVEAFVEETIALWDGGPMAVDCAGARSGKQVESGLPFGLKYSLPSGSAVDDLKPPVLRYGWPYRFGMRAVFMGGGSVAINEGEGYEALDGSVAYPCSVPKPAPETAADGSAAGKDAAGTPQPREQVRCLRHHRLDAPFLLLPAGHATRSNSPMAYEQAASVVVRSVELDSYASPEARDVAKRATPTLAQRIFVAPTLDRADAARHAVFDKPPQTSKSHPGDGIRFARYDAEKGGFRSVVTTTVPGIDGKKFPEKRQISGSAALNDSEFTARGDQVFEASGGDSARPVPYYPDPCAMSYVIALRDPASGAFLEGDPCVLASRLKGKNFTDVMPLLVTVVRQSGFRLAKPKLQDVISVQAKFGLIDPAQTGDVRKKGSILAQQAVATLYPGEDFEMVVWCVPSAARLAHSFSVIQSLGVAAVHGKPVEGKTPEVAALAHLSTLIGDKLAGDVKLKLSPDSVWATAGFAGPGGLPSPSPLFLTALASAVRSTMETRPIDEIAATRTLRVTHAINRPARAPAIPQQTGAGALMVARPEPKRIEAAKAKPYNSIDLFDAERRIDQGAADFAIGGVVHVDLETSDSFELIAETVFPRTVVFDDRKRGRDLFSRRTDSWPYAVRAEAVQEFKTPREVFGFDVDSNGLVTLPPSNVTLLRVEGLARPMSSEDQIDTVELGAFYAAKSGAEPYLKVSHPHAFPDGKARKLKLRVDASSRSAALMETSNRIEQDILGIQKWQVPGKPLDREFLIRGSNIAEVYLPATFRSAKCDAAAPFPGFSWTITTANTGGTNTYTVTRDTYIRIPLAREWFSNGEDEKVGIVVWPPDMFEPGKGLIDKNQVLYESKVSETRSIDLFDFEDEHLGPGGGFVTRWGGDPIREGSHDQGRFMPPRAFKDLGQSIGDRVIARHVSNVLMPVAEESEKLEESAAGGAPAEAGAVTREPAIQTMMTVGLIVYEPRFDIEKEEWFIDVNVTPGTTPDPFVRFGLVRYQEHTRRDLQLSFPITQWAQILPCRKASVVVHQTKIVVTVRGPATSGTRKVVYGSPITNRYDGKPVMQAELVHEYSTAAGIMRRRVGDVVDSGLSNEEHSQHAWRCELPLPPVEERRRFGPGRFFVFVQEVERRRPATYELEPLPLDQIRLSPELLAELEKGTLHDSQKKGIDPLETSGPRFSARINIELL